VKYVYMCIKLCQGCLHLQYFEYIEKEEEEEEEVEENEGKRKAEEG